MSQREQCPTCRQMVNTEWPHSCYDHDAVERLRDAERAVIDAAVAWADAWFVASVTDTDFGVSPLQRSVPQLHALDAAVRSLREVTP